MVLLVQYRPLKIFPSWRILLPDLSNVVVINTQKYAILQNSENIYLNEIHFGIQFPIKYIKMSTHCIYLKL